MKRLLGALVSGSLIVVSIPPAAWAQFSEAAAGAGSATVGMAAAAGASAAPRVAALGSAPLVAPSLAASGLSAPALAAPAFAAAALPRFAPGLRPFEFSPHTVAVAVPARVATPAAPAEAVPAARPAEEAAPAGPISGTVEGAVPGAAALRGGDGAAARELSLPAARSGFFAAAAAAFAAPDARPAAALERLFTGAAERAELAEPAPALGVSRPAAASELERAAAPADLAASRAAPPAPDAAPAPRRSRAVAALAAVGRVALAAGAVVGLNALGVALSPAIFGIVPVAAVWAVSSGVLLFPAALYARYRLARRDSPRLDKVKWTLDLAIGAYAGALAIAAPSLALVLTGAGLLKAAVPLAGLAAGLAARGSPFLNSVMTWGALAATPLAIGAAAAGGLALAPILGMLSLPVATTIAFFLGSIISSAETGRPFSVPGSLQKMRFPSFQWVMTGVVFALLTGYSAVHANAAFMIWQFLGSRQPAAWDKTAPLWKNLLNKAANFDLMYLGLLAYVAATGFASPLTFIVIAFSGERAAVWTERLLGRFLPRSRPAPSTKSAPVEDSYAGDKPAAWPQFHYWAKGAAIIAAMAGAGALMGATVFGFHSLLTSLIPAALLSFLPYWFSAKIIKVVMHDTPADEASDPEFFAIMRAHRDRINARRRAKGQKEIPMPEMVNDPLPLPNAYATGRDPFHAVVAVTAGIKEMTLDPENVREGVARLIAATDPKTKAFRVFRLAISGSIPGVTLESTPAEIQSAVLQADRPALKALGVRMLSGVLGHEFSHEMDGHMRWGAFAGAIASSIAFASYGVMWAVGHAQVVVKKGLDRVLGRSAPSSSLRASVPGMDGEDADAKRPEFVDPISAGVAVKSLPALLKLFAALWVPVLVQIVQMASSRNNEGMADEDGALLSEDPQSLALALGLLTTWRPKTGFQLPGLTLPRVVALSHLMTVNPIEQAYDAGALPKLDAATEAVVGKGDDFLFDLFVTHPDTGVRIERLADMAEALRASKPAPRPPTGDGGGKPLAFVGPAAPAPAENGGGLFRRVWAKLKGFVHVLPDPDRNRAFWNFTLGQALVTVGFNFNYTALPGLLASNKADTDKLTENRAINWGAQAASSLLTGPLVDRQPAKRVIVWAYIGRGVLMSLVPVLFLTGHFGFAAFSLVIGMAGFLQATTGNAASVAFNRILGDDESYYNRANAVMTIVTDAVGVVAPLLAGAFLAFIGAHFAMPLLGNAMAFGVYAVTLLMAGVGYGFFLKIPRDETTNLRRGLQKQLKDADLGGAKVKGVTAGAVDGKPGLLVEVAGADPASVKGLPAEYEGYPVKAVAARNPVRELIEGFRIAFADRFLRLYLITTTVAISSGDALTFAALTRYLNDVLHAGAGAFGVLLAASSLGLAVSSVVLSLLKNPMQSALAPAAVEFRKSLAQADPTLDAAHLDHAAAALRGSLSTVLEGYVEDWRKDAARERTTAALAEDVLAEAARAVAGALKIDPAQAAARLEASGASRDVRLWAARRGEKLLASTRKDAETGMDSLQRQGRWSAYLQGVSWLVYAGMFFAGSLHMAVGLMLLSSALAGAESIIWSSLSTRVIAGNYPQDQGKVYSAMSFYWLACSVVGVLGFGWLLTILPTATALLVTAGVLAACAVFSVLQGWRSFPLARR
jgi:Zn-dependent protease with chaperone function/MFS family permease